MINIILSTCGTSTLTNFANEEERKLVTKYANIKTQEEITDPQDKSKIEKLVEQGSEKVKALSIEEAKKYSAELNAIIAYYDGGQLARHEKDEHFLLATDTYLGQVTANIVKTWLNQNGFEIVTVHFEGGLQTADFISFKAACAQLVKWCKENFGDRRDPTFHVVFNLSGGFKSESGFLQILGMLYADEVIYIFERTKDLMRIPRLPLKMDAEDYVRNHLMEFRTGTIIPLKKVSEADRDSIYWDDYGDTGYSLSAWGEAVFESHKDSIYEEQVWASPTVKIVYGSKFLDSVKDETAKHNKQINEQIDRLMQYQLQPNQPNPNSLHYQPISNPPSCATDATHEFYAWSDEDAKRIYCKTQPNGVIELICLGKHL